MKTFGEKERNCEAVFFNNGPFWHVCTPGSLSAQIFCDDDDFRFAVNLLARCVLDSHGVGLVAYAIMGNHVHLVMSGLKADVVSFFGAFRKRLSRYIAGTDRFADLASFEPSCLEIKTLTALRNTISYVHRNGYLISCDHTPFSYPWSSGRFYFNDIRIERTYLSLGSVEKRKLFHSRSIEIPSDYGIVNGHISPESFCDLVSGMGAFRDAHHYYLSMFRNVEAYGAIAEAVGDTEFMTDSEAYIHAYRLAKGRFQIQSMKDLTRIQRMELAKSLHYETKCSNEQIRRVLGLQIEEINAMFPKL